jgi:two-component system response regulator HydG
MACNLLVVEDEPLARSSIATVLERAEYNVFQAGTGEAALDLIARVTFNTVISDFQLPGHVNGIDVLKCQYRASPGKQLILITAFGSHEVELEAKAMGAVYIEKPFLLKDLLSKIHPPM